MTAADSKCHSKHEANAKQVATSDHDQKETTMIKPSRHPMATFFVVCGTSFVATTAVSGTLAATGGEATGREAVVVIAVAVAVAVAALAVVWAAYRWVCRTLDRQSREFMDRLYAPMTDPRNLAARYFDEHLAPDLRRDGMPDDGIAHLRQRYITDATANPEAVRQLREMYPTDAAKEATR